MSPLLRRSSMRSTANGTATQCIPDVVLASDLPWNSWNTMYTGEDSVLLTSLSGSVQEADLHDRDRRGAEEEWEEGSSPARQSTANPQGMCRLLRTRNQNYVCVTFAHFFR